MIKSVDSGDVCELGEFMRWRHGDDWLKQLVVLLTVAGMIERRIRRTCPGDRAQDFESWLEDGKLVAAAAAGEFARFLDDQERSQN